MIRSLLHFHTALLLAFAAASLAAPPFATDVNRHSVVTAVPKLIYLDENDPTALVPGQNVLRKDFGGIPGTPVAAETDPERYHVGSPSIICITTTAGYPREYLVAFDRRPNSTFGLSYNLSSPDGNYINDSPQMTIFKVTRSISTTEPPAEELLSAYQCTIPGIVGGSLFKKGDNIYLLGSGAAVTTTNGVKTYASKPRITQLVLNAEGKYVAASLVDLTLNIPSYVARSAFGGGDRYHNANFMTFHRIVNFRTNKDIADDIARNYSANAEGQSVYRTLPVEP